MTGHYFDKDMRLRAPLLGISHPSTDIGGSKSYLGGDGRQQLVFNFAVLSN